MDDASDGGYSRAPELEDLLKLCAALNHEAVRYVLIGGFAVILHGFVRGTKDIDLLVDASDENVRALKRALAVFPDNAVAAVADGEVRQYQVVRVADEVVIDLMQAACGIDYPAALAGGVETHTVEGVNGASHSGRWPRPWEGAGRSEEVLSRLSDRALGAAPIDRAPRPAAEPSPPCAGYIPSVT